MSKADFKTWEEINMEVQLKETERIDDLQLKGLKLIQDTNGFWFGIDSV